MILRIIPYLLIILPIVGFFFSPEPPPSEGRGALIANLAYFLFMIPWWGKLLSIIIGVIWISRGNEKMDNAE